MENLTQGEEKKTFEQEAYKHNMHAAQKLKEFTHAQEEEREKLAESFSDGILSIDKTEVYDVCTGTGGPACGFRIYVTVSTDNKGKEFKEVSHATSYFQDWGTPKQEMELCDDAQDTLLSLVYIEGVC